MSSAETGNTAGMAAGSSAAGAALSGAAVQTSRPLDASADRLTAREIQVLQHMAEGLSTKEIASTLRVSFKTAASHRSRILGKLGVHETVSAVRWAIRIGLIQP
jgi:DNA-binding NarL/FixJ family response regulator